MSMYEDRTRIVFGKAPGERYPLVVGAIRDTTWEIIPPEEWDAIKREWAERWIGPDWAGYDYIEVVVTIPAGQIAAMFDAREVSPTSVVRDEEASDDA